MASDDNDSGPDGPIPLSTAHPSDTSTSGKVTPITHARRKRAPRAKVTGDDSESAPSTRSLPQAPWVESLALDSRGQVRNSAANLTLFLRHLEEWQGALSLNEFANRIIWRHQPPHLPGFRAIPMGEFAEAHVLLIHAFFARYYGVGFSEGTVLRAVHAVAAENPSDPVRSYLKDIVWDEQERLPRWLSTYCGVEENSYTSAVGKAWMISAVARVLEPGCKVDSVLVLEGRQGLFKSAALRTLAGDYFLDHVPDLKSKDARVNLAGRWIIELAELEGLSTAAVATVKAFLTVQEDTYRPPYGRVAITFPRRCVFAATTNAQTWLRDKTGNRRFWPVHVSQPIDLERLAHDRDQLWAEARVRFERREPWHLVDREIIALAADEQNARVQSDPWEAKIAALLKGKKKATAEGVLSGLKPNVQGQSKGDLMRVTEVLAKIGWTKRRETRTEVRERENHGLPFDSTLLDQSSPRRLVLWEPTSTAEGTERGL